MPTDSPTNRCPIIVPDLRVGSEQVRISAWLMEPGQKVVAGDRVVEILVPGITFDIESTTCGELVEIVRPVDAVVAIGEIVGWIEIDA